MFSSSWAEMLSGIFGKCLKVICLGIILPVIKGRVVKKNKTHLVVHILDQPPDAAQSFTSFQWHTLEKKIVSLVVGLDI